MLNKKGLLPISILANVEEEVDISDYYPFGCSVFVLDEKNQSGLGGTPKWDPKSRAGVCIGRSPVHASNFALILNLTTGHVIPQFDLVFDYELSTVKYLHSNNTHHLTG